MTQSLSNLSTSLSRFEAQISHFKEEANKIASSQGIYPEEKFKQIKDECIALQTERNLLRNEFDKIKQTLKENIQDAIWNKFNFLDKQYSKLNDKLSLTYSMNVTSSKIDNLSKQYYDVNKMKDTDFNQLDKIKNETLEIMKQPALKTLLLQKAIQLYSIIDNEQNVMVGEQLHILHCLTKLALDAPQDPDFYIGKMKEIFNGKLQSSDLGRQTRNDLITNLRKDICARWGLTFRILHSQDSLDLLTSDLPIFDNLPKLAQVISEHPLFKQASPPVDDGGYTSDDSDESIPGLEDVLQTEPSSPEVAKICPSKNSTPYINLLDEDPYQTSLEVTY